VRKSLGGKSKTQKIYGGKSI